MQSVQSADKRNMNRNWLVNKTNPEFLEYIAGKASISPMLAQVLVNRGMKSEDAIREFLTPSLDDLHDPFLMPDMQKAVDRIKSAIERNETVFILGDYDADGLTATAVMIFTLTQLGLNTAYHIPNRIIEGYGMSSEGVQKAKDRGAGLIITVDCGITSEQEVLNARSMGMDVIITDHHEPPETLPQATAVIDPHRGDSRYPFKYLAGVGVAFKLVQALLSQIPNLPAGRQGPKSQILLEDLLDIVALGTIADSVPLTGENRVFVTYGLEKINSGSCRLGIQAMKDNLSIDKPLSSVQLSFTLIPRINAAGRLDDAGEVVRLFLTDDTGVANGVAGLLDEQNGKRRKIEADVLKSALEMIGRENPGNAIVLSSPDWHPGVVGIVASRIVDMFYRPVFLFSEKDGYVRGSARGIPAFHLYQAIAECEELLLGYGGHRQAAGLRLSVENLPLFRERMNAIVDRKLSASDMLPVLEIDAAVKFADLSFDLIKELRMLEPFGNANREPMFGSKDIQIVNHRIVGNNHLKMQLKQKTVHFDTIGFGMGDQMSKLEDSVSLDVAFIPGINEWNGTRNLQLNLKAIRPSGGQEKGCKL